MDWLKLGIGIAIVLGLTAAWWGLNNALEEHYQAPLKAQMLADKQRLDACKIDKETALAANLTLQEDLKKLALDLSRLSANLDKLRKAGEASKAESEKVMAQAKDRLAKLGAENYDLLFTLSKPDPGGSCEERMGRIDGILRGLGMQRMRDHPPKAGSSVQGGTVGNKGSGADTLRIVQ